MKAIVIMNNPIVNQRIQTDLAKCFSQSVRQLIKECEITPAEGYNMESSVIDRFKSDAVCQAYNCDNLQQVLEYMVEVYDTEFDYSPN